jgi:purine catabolism regulator
VRVTDVLDLFPDLHLRAGSSGAEAKVLWVHVVDQPDMGHWLRDGTFVLTSGIGWGEGEKVFRTAVREVAAAGAAALLVATGRFLREIPQTVLADADELGLPLIEAPFSLPFIDITSTIQRLLVGEQYKILEQADHIHRELTQAALRSRSVGQLLARLGEALGCDAAVYTSRERVGIEEELASAGFPPERAAVATAVRRLGDPSVTCALEVAGRGALIVPVRQGDEGYTILALFARSGDFGVLERTVAGHAATVVALQLAHQRELADVERRVHASFVDALLSGAYQPGDAAAEERARLRGIDPAASFRVVIARADSGPALSSRAEFTRRQDLLLAVEANLGAMQRQVATTSSLNRVILLWPAGTRDREQLTRLRQGIVARLRQSVVLAASSQVTGLAGVRRAGWEAERLLSAAPPDAELLFYEDQLVLRLLQRNDPVLRRELRDVVLGRLLSVPGGAKLADTLEALVACGYRQHEAAERLGVHRNTMLKRVARIEELIGRPLSDPETRTLVYLSLVLRRTPE